ncbi:unnamed protein product [Ilex paraguariensis]|uniref:Leucine-rich repeat-containing N-terminal plant-type domain-containing protein n=1 Tax=Ilex paraguariensis TaxID=185542 RepID=A0ABC8UGT3_9AQUA
MDVILVTGQCLSNQRVLLLQLRNSLTFDSSISTKLVQWNQTTDCCRWNGVNCDYAGQVIGLDLSSESISGGIDNSSSLFSLRSLHRLNLASNNFDFAQLPPEFGKLTSLTYLNLSESGFAGKIPSEFSQMTRLMTLDLSTSFYSLELENPNLKMLIQDLTELRELYLDGVNISAQGYEWCHSISSSLPHLQVLSMSNCYLSGPFDSSLLKLRSLSVVRLDGNPLFSSIPEFFTNFSNLTVLSLSSCDLLGAFPNKIFQVPTLHTLDLSNNRLLEGSLPEFPENGSFQNLVLSYTKFFGRLPLSIGSLGLLSMIEIRSCNFSGPIPYSLASLTHLVSLDFSSNNFNGSIPSFSLSKNLTEINLYNNCLTGGIPFSNWEHLENLVFLDLSYNFLSGNIPAPLFFLPLLKVMYLSNNRFSGRISEFAIKISNLLGLEVIDLSSNSLEGQVPKFLFQIQALASLSLSSNNFEGMIELQIFENLKNLVDLDLSYNNLLVSARDSNSAFSLLPQFTTLRLASCKLQELPDLKNQSRLMTLDLSDNQLHGEIPNWIWELGNGQLRFVNLSHNLFSNLQEPYVFHRHDYIDLHSNVLHGEIPIPPRSAAYIDYSSNNFSSSIPADIGNHLPSAFFLSISNNKLTGIIPGSICNASRLEVLDLSNNFLHGTVPSCLIEKNSTLKVLNLTGNNITESKGTPFQQKFQPGQNARVSAINI